MGFPMGSPTENQGPQHVPCKGTVDMQSATQRHARGHTACMDHPLLNKGMSSIPIAPWIFFHLPKCCESVRPQSAATYSLLPWFWLFSILHISEIMQYFSFCVWLILLSVKFSRLIHVDTNDRILFLFLEWVLFHYKGQFINSSVDT